MIRRAGLKDLKSIMEITRDTIEKIYPRYYPRGAVDFFLSHHNIKNILEDIESESVFLQVINDKAVGTVTVKHNEICRLFVLPRYQGRGYGGELLEFAEAQAAERSESTFLDASLPAKEIYFNHGYKVTASHAILTENGDYLCYDVMVKLWNR